jgi:hypothetical protein
MTEMNVIIRGQRVPVSVSRRANSLWIARGEYHGHIIETEGRRDRVALARWLELAEQRGA